MVRQAQRRRRQGEALAQARHDVCCSTITLNSTARRGEEHLTFVQLQRKPTGGAYRVIRTGQAWPICALRLAIGRPRSAK